MFNPNPKKGGDIVLELIKRNPKKNFLLILGWANYVPLEYNFENYKNKLIILPQEDIAEIYSYTKLLLSNSPPHACRMQASGGWDFVYVESVRR